MADNRAPAVRSAIMRAVKGKHTGPELIVRRALHALGYRFRLHRKDLPGTPDIVLPAHGVAIFVHGCFWHGHRCRKGRPPTSNVAFWSAKIARNKVRDRAARALLRKQGWRCLTIWQCQTRDCERLADVLGLFLGARSESKDTGRRRTG